MAHAHVEIVAWLILRIVYAWMFLYPLKDFLRDWPKAVDTIKIIMPWRPNLMALLMILVMILGSLSILFGIYARIAGFLFLVFSLLGVVVHYRLAKTAASLKLSENADEKDRQILNQTSELAVVGNMTSAQKNIVLAAVACFFMLIGSGPWSITS